MAGILDKKTRVLDYILTEEGKRQLANGDIRFVYASFTDSGALYLDNGYGISDDEYKLINFEPVSSNLDKIVPEFDITGHINYPYDTDGVSLRNSTLNIETDYEYLKAIDNLRDYSKNSLISQSIILSEDISNNSDMNIEIEEGKNDIDINFENIFKYHTLSMYQSSLDKVLLDENLLNENLIPENDPLNLYELNELFNDTKFYSQENYKLMPPVNKDGTLLSNYYSKNENISNEIISGLDLFLNVLGKEVPTKREDIFQESYDFINKNNFIKSFNIDFIKSSFENNIGIQLFEVGNQDSKKTFSKLVAVDHGDQNIITSEGVRKSVRIVSFGKIVLKTKKDLSDQENDLNDDLRYIMENKMSYVNIFTLTME